MPLGVIDGTGPQASGQRVPVSGVENRGKTLPEVPTELLDTSRTANLYAQVVNRLPRSWASLVVMARRASSADRWAGSSSSAPEIRCRAARRLSPARATQQQTVQPRQCLLTGPSRAAQRRQPPRCLTIRAVNEQHACRYYDPALEPSRAQRAVLPGTTPFNSARSRRAERNFLSRRDLGECAVKFSSLER